MPGCGIQLSIAGGGIAGGAVQRPPVTDYFNGLTLPGSTFSGGPTVVADNTGALVTSPAGVLPIEGMRLATTVADGAVLGPELVTNGDFSSSAGWTLAAGFVISSGVLTINTAVIGNAYRSGLGSAGTRYSVTFNLLSIASGAVSPRLRGVNGTARNSPGVYTEEIVAGNINNFFGVVVHVAAGDCVIDNFSVREVIPTWVATTSLGAQIHPSTPLRTRKGTVSVYGEDFRGTLVEPARTNLALNSGDIGLSGTNLGVTIAAGDVSPLGVASKRVTFPLATPGSYVRHVIDKDYNSATAIWWLIKPITVPTGAQVRVTGANSYFGVFYDLATMSFVSSFGSVSAHGVVALSGGWYGIYCVGTYNLNGAGGNVLSSTVDNTVIDIAAVQIENGTFPTSYIPTAAATVTRDAKNLTRPTAGSGLETGNNFAIYGRVVPKAAGSGLNVYLWSNYIDISNYFIVFTLTNNTTLRVGKNVNANLYFVDVTHSVLANTPFEYLAYQHSVHGMGIAVRSWNGSAWSAWATNADTQNAPIASTYQIGARNNANHFAANYPFTKIIALNPALNPQMQLADLLSKGRI